MADVFSSSPCGCSVSTVKNPDPVANVYRLQPVATDNNKTMYSVSTVLGLHLAINEMLGRTTS